MKGENKMAFKKPKINKVKSTMESLQIYLRAERKFGKTTLFRDIIQLFACWVKVNDVVFFDFSRLFI